MGRHLGGMLETLHILFCVVNYIFVDRFYGAPTQVRSYCAEELILANLGCYKLRAKQPGVKTTSLTEAKNKIIIHVCFEEVIVNI
jgi:hypothetical protein